MDEVKGEAGRHEPEKAFNEDLYNTFFRALGCRFCGDRPGTIVEVWGEGASGTGSIACALLKKLVACSGCQFHCPPIFERAFEALWQMLDLKRRHCLMKTELDGVLRITACLAAEPISNAVELAVECMELTVGQLVFESMKKAAGGMQMTGKPHSVFISYSHQDEPLVTPIVRLLQVVEPGTFQDKISIGLGQDWRELIATTIEQVGLIIVFWSRHSAASEEARKEWMHGLRLFKKVVPVLLDSTPLDPELAAYQALDFRRLSVARTTRDEEGGLHEELKLGLDAVSAAEGAMELLAFVHRG